MTGNSSFTTPFPPLQDVRDGLASYNTALAAAADGGREQTSLKNGARAELSSLLRQLALYVQQASAGNEAAILSSGLGVRKTRQPAGVLPPPEWVTLRTNNVSGRFHLTCKPVRNARSYEVEARTSGDAAWTNRASYSSSRMVVEGLTPGVVYTFRVRPIGAAGPGGFSDPVSAMAV